MNQEEAMFGTEVKPKKKINFSKWFALGLGGIFGISHVGMIGLLATRQQQSKFPVIQPPVGPYTSYVISSSENGYKISYSANDPKTAFITKDIKKKAGFLGLSTNKSVITEEYFMDGQINQGGPVSNHRSWQDPATLNPNASKGISSTLTPLPGAVDKVKFLVEPSPLKDVAVITPLEIVIAVPT